MAMSDNAIVGLAEELIQTHRRTMQPQHHHGKIRRYLRGEHDRPYMPEGAKAEYRAMARKSITNWLPLLSDTFAKALFVDGYRPAKTTDNARPWNYWQANGMDARQTVTHRGALEYGAAHVLVLPSDGAAPLIRPISPTRVLAFYEDEDDDWPAQALLFKGRHIDGSLIYQVFEGGAIHTLVTAPDQGKGDFLRPFGLPPSLETGGVSLVGSEEHGLGIVPLVRFRERLDVESRGIIWPAIRVQDQINDVVFATNMAIQYASHRQRWATGLAIPVDEQETLPDGSPNPNFGRPVEAFESAVDRLWVSDSPEARFGDFAQTEVSGHLTTYQNKVRTLAAISQVSPLVLLGDLVNLSADALASVQDTTTRKAAEYETIFGEAWEQTFRLAAFAAGDEEAALDTSAQVRWRDSEARSLASTVDALGKMAQMLMVPAEELWSRIPGVTDQDVERWKETAGRADGLGALVAELQRQGTPGTPQEPAQSANTAA